MAKKINLDMEGSKKERTDARGRTLRSGVSVMQTIAEEEAVAAAKAKADPMSMESRVRKLSRAATVASGVAALGLAFGLYTGATSSAELAKMHDGMTNVVVAAQTVEAGDTITSDMLAVKEVPKEYVSSGALSKTEAFVGQVAGTRIDSGSQVTDSMLSASRNTASLANATKAGKKAVTISVDDSQGFSGLLKVGDEVDVLGKKSGEKSMYRITSKATVIALGSSLDGSASSYPTVTVEVSSKEADSIRSAASISLELHSKADTNKNSQKSVSASNGTAEATEGTAQDADADAEN